MTAHGQIEEFHRDLKWWALYVEQLECYFVANNVADTSKQYWWLKVCTLMTSSLPVVLSRSTCV